MDSMQYAASVYVVTHAVYREFADYSSLGHPAVFTDKTEAEEYYEEVANALEDSEVIYVHETEGLRIKKRKFANGDVHEYNFVVSPILLDTPQYTTKL